MPQGGQRTSQHSTPWGQRDRESIPWVRLPCRAWSPSSTPWADANVARSRPRTEEGAGFGWSQADSGGTPCEAAVRGGTVDADEGGGGSCASVPAPADTGAPAPRCRGSGRAGQGGRARSGRRLSKVVARVTPVRRSEVGAGRATWLTWTRRAESRRRGTPSTRGPRRRRPRPSLPWPAHTSCSVASAGHCQVAMTVSGLLEERMSRGTDLRLKAWSQYSHWKGFSLLCFER